MTRSVGIFRTQKWHGSGNGELSLEVTPFFATRRHALWAVLCALAPILFAGGCALPRPPVQISAFAPEETNSEATPNIAGIYANQGDAFTVKGENLGPVLLSRLLLIDKFQAPSWQGGISNQVHALYGANSAYADADSVIVLKKEPDMIEMQFFKQGHAVAGRRVSKYTWNRATSKGWGIFANWDQNKYGEPYFVVKGYLDITTQEEHAGAAGIGFYQKANECLLRKAADGSLLVLHRAQLFGAVGIAPFWSNDYIWCRFPPIEQSGQPRLNPGIK